MKVAHAVNAANLVGNVVTVKFKLLKGVLKIVGIGAICYIVAPQACLDALIELLSGLRLMGTGVWGMAIDEGAKAVGKGIGRGFMHPTEGAIGWDIISIIKSLF